MLPYLHHSSPSVRLQAALTLINIISPMARELLHSSNYGESDDTDECSPNAKDSIEDSAKNYSDGEKWRLKMQIGVNEKETETKRREDKPPPLYATDPTVSVPAHTHAERPSSNRAATSTQKPFAPTHRKNLSLHSSFLGNNGLIPQHATVTIC